MRNKKFYYSFIFHFTASITIRIAYSFSLLRNDLKKHQKSPWILHHTQQTFGLESSTRADCDTAVTPTQERILELTMQAMEMEGTQRCRALEELDQLCCLREPFSFHNNNAGKRQGTVQKIPMCLSKAQTDHANSLVRQLLHNGWMSTNPDSVDGLPSFHVNLVTQGKPLFEAKKDNSTSTANPFQECIVTLCETLQEFLYDELEPYVRHQLGRDDLCVADVFIRTYGAGERTSLSAHYDVTSYATVVIALDGAAESGTNGLYTCDGNSNHVALRRFFPLARGEGVLHTWDILHGVHIEPDVERTSLIIWFSTQDQLTSTGDDEDKNNSAVTPPWLQQENDLGPLSTADDGGVDEFVLASAMESSSCENPTNKKATVTNLYLASAAKSNPFALTRLGTMCEDHSLEDRELVAVRAMLRNLPIFGHDGKSSSFALDTIKGYDVGDQSVSMELAKECWYFASTFGNGMAQMALADQLMYECTSSSEDEKELPTQMSKRWLVATLFVLAAQQGCDLARESIFRCIDWEATHSASKKDFLQSPMLAIASTYLSGSS